MFEPNFMSVHPTVSYKDISFKISNVDPMIGQENETGRLVSKIKSSGNHKFPYQNS